MILFARYLLLTTTLVVQLPLAFGWTTPTAATAPSRSSHRRHHSHSSFRSSSLLRAITAASTTNSMDAADESKSTTPPATVNSTTSFKAIFDFSEPDTIEKIDRLDDAIMGGISTSAVTHQSSDHGGYARWGGVCRTDGGGFCGFRTNPFQEPLMVGDSDGLYVSCRLTSDNEPERRVWKMTTRTKPDRGELLYQAPFNFTSTSTTTSSTSDSNDSWTIVKVPFDSFKLVRGPRMIANGPPLNTTAGLYQIGMTMSKFVFGMNTTAELENFRDGFFELQVKEIGLYKDNVGDDASIIMEDAVVAPKVFSKLEAKKQRPVLLKVLIPLSKIFFSEQSQRRKSAMRILREEWKLSRGRAILWGLKSRAKSSGMVRSVTKTMSILAVDSFRFLLSTALRILLVYPIRLIRGVVGLLTGNNKQTSTTE